RLCVSKNVIHKGEARNDRVECRDIAGRKLLLGCQERERADTAILIAGGAGPVTLQTEISRRIITAILVVANTEVQRESPPDLILVLEEQRVLLQLVLIDDGTVVHDELSRRATVVL